MCDKIYGYPLRRSTESRLKILRQDAIAGIINAAVSIPDGLASAALAGTNPVYGLYTSIFAPLAGGLLMSAETEEESSEAKDMIRRFWVALI